MGKTVKELLDSVDTAALVARPLSDWRPILSQECQVYVFNENYLAKRFDQIHYKFCEKNEAKEILVDNLYALLRYKYFPKTSEEIDDRINKIVSSFTANLKTTLIKVSFDKSSDAIHVKMLPDYCVAFRNGVYNFKNDNWLFKYDVIKLSRINNTIYAYTPEYIIQWYFDYEFEPLPIKVTDTSLTDFVKMMKELTKTNQNYCFELLYNIAHDSSDTFSFQKFQHLCEILGYTVLQSFSQYFVMLIGSGQNGKNSLFDGCFTNRIIPRPAANDLDSIENDRFITGALENKAHNIFLETSAKTYTESKMIKALTGSMYQTIESKGVSKYSGVVNCKYVFAGNDQDKIKFSDTTTGFRRRINMYEIWYHWDSSKRFLKKGDYYDTTFSDSLSELKDDVVNTTTYVYFAMYGILSGTAAFTKNFQFNDNEWTYKYSDVDLDMRDKIESITCNEICRQLAKCKKEEAQVAFFDTHSRRLQDSPSLRSVAVIGYDGVIEMLNNPELYTSYFAEYDAFISIRFLQAILKDFSTATTFTQTIKKIYALRKFEFSYANKPYLKCNLAEGKLKIIS